MFSIDDPHIGAQKVFAWTGIVMLGLFILGFWVIAGYVPPSNPHGTVKEIVHFYASNETAIHLGLWMTMIAAAFCVTFFTSIALQMRRIEGKHSLLSFAQMLFGALFAIEFIIPLMIWQAADYRPTLDPDMTYRLHDLGWLFFLGVVSTGVIQAVLIGVIILRDKRPQPIFPRWLGYLSIWAGLLFMPGGLIVFFKSGPLDWRGLVAFWLLLAAFGIWVLALVWALVARAIPDHERETRTAAQT
ncbi:MAG: DUF4386 family protein [Solirubrobacteraceae bacterium]